MIVYAGQANVVGLALAKKASNAGDPITTGTVNFYLLAQDGTNAGKWYRGSDGTWQASESVAGAATHQADGHWKLSLASAVWTAGVRYRLYGKESGDLHIPSGVDVVCDPVKPQTDKIGGSSHTVQSPVGSVNVEIVAGDSYTAAQPLRFVKTGWSGPTMTGGTVALRIVDKETHDDGSDEAAALVVSGTISQSGTTVTADFALTASQTAALDVTQPPNDKYPYVYQVIGTDTDGVARTIALGGLNVRRRVPAS